jgi:hypothetical protein
MYKIKMETIKQEKKQGTKTVWETKQTENENITEQQYKNIIEAAPFFRRLGGSESMQKAYTCKGYTVVRNISTSPDKQNRTIRSFEFSWEDKK